MLAGRRQVQEGPRPGVIAGVDQQVAVCRQAQDVVLGKNFEMAFHRHKGIDFFETAFGRESSTRRMAPIPPAIR